jgi:hypothetical protein
MTGQADLKPIISAMNAGTMMTDKTNDKTNDIEIRLDRADCDDPNDLQPDTFCYVGPRHLLTVPEQEDGVSYSVFLKIPEHLIKRKDINITLVLGNRHQTVHS